MFNRYRFINDICWSRLSLFNKRLSNVFEVDKAAAAAKSSARGKTKCVAGLNGLLNAKPSFVVRIAPTRAR
jgi:hypothetical protein